MKRVVILGGGRVGSAMAMDMARDAGVEVTVVDARAEALDALSRRFGVRTLRADLAEAAAIERAVADADVVLGALASVLGLGAMRAVIDAGKDYCDISFMEEDPRPSSTPSRGNGA